MGMQDDAILALKTAARSPGHRFEAAAMLGRLYMRRVSPYLTRLLILSWRFNDPGLPARRRLDWPRGVDAELRKLTRDKGVPYISLYDLLCDAKDCTMLVDATTPLQWDYGHMTPEGSRYVAGLMRARGLFPEGPAPAPSPGNR